MTKNFVDLVGVFAVVTAVVFLDPHEGVAIASDTKDQSAACATWAGKYYGLLQASQNLMGTEQNISMSIDKSGMAAIIKGSDSPQIYIWSTRMQCDKYNAHITFSDNSGGGGRILLSSGASYSLRFSRIREGSSRNFEGYFPESIVELKRSEGPDKSTR